MAFALLSGCFSSMSDCAVSTSNVVVFGLGVGLPLMLSGWWFYRAYQKRREALLSKRKDAKSDRFLCGTVVVDEGADPPVMVRIYQRAVTTAVDHRWYETRREIEARPFRLRLADGRTVSVDPRSQIRFVADLDGIDMSNPSPTERYRTAILAPGDEVYVVGETGSPDGHPSGGPYRDSANVAVHGTRQLPLYVSRKPLYDLHARRSRLYLRAALATLSVFAMLHGTLFLEYHVLRCAGHVATVAVGPVHRRPSTMFDVYPLAVTLPDGRMVQESAPLGLYQRVQAGQASTAPIIIAGPFRQLGDSVTQGAGKLLFFCIFALGYLVGCTLYLRSLRAWWEGGRVIDRGHGPVSKNTISPKAGRLADS